MPARLASQGGPNIVPIFNTSAKIITGEIVPTAQYTKGCLIETENEVEHAFAFRNYHV